MSDNTALLLIGYNRPELLLKRLSEIAEMEVRHVYIAIDGGKESHTTNMRRSLSEARSLLLDKTTLQIIHQKHNLGMSKHITKSISYAFESHNSLIVVEDDIELNKYFFKNMCIGLKILSNRKKLGTVSAFSPLNFGGEKLIKNMWRSTPYFYCWGWGCSKETWKHYKIDISDQDPVGSLSSSASWSKLSNFQKNYWLSKFEKVKKDKNFTWDYQMQFASFKYDFLNLSPKYRFVNNVGFNDVRAVHTKGPKPFILRVASKNTRVVKKESNKLINMFFQIIESNLFIQDTKLAQNFKRFNTLFKKFLSMARS